MDNINPNNPNWPFPPRVKGTRYYGPPKRIFVWTEDAFWYGVFPIVFLVTLRYTILWIAAKNGLDLRVVPPEEYCPLASLYIDIIVHLVWDPDFDED